VEQGTVVTRPEPNLRSMTDKSYASTARQEGAARSTG
jgi:hypothetical protein